MSVTSSPLTTPAQGAAWSRRREAPGSRVVALLVAVIAGLLVTAATAPAYAAPGPPPPSRAEQTPDTVGLRLLEVPAELAGDPRAQSYVVDDVTAGSSFTRRMEITNTTGRAQDVSLYAGPADVQKGRWVVGEPGSANELASWISLSTGSVTVPAGRSRPASVTIEVPDDAAAGERYGVIWAATSASAQGGMTVVNRVGVRVYLAVSGGSELTSDFAIRTLAPSRDDDGFPLVTATVENIGERALDLQGALRLREGPGGIKAGPFTVPPGITVGVGETVEVPIRAPEDLPDGPWEARVLLRSGLVEHTARATLTFPATADAGPGVPTAPTVAGPEALPSTGLGPWVAPLMILGLLAGLLAVLVLLRRRREERALATGTSTAALTDQDWLASLDDWRRPQP